MSNGTLSLANFENYFGKKTIYFWYLILLCTGQVSVLFTQFPAYVGGDTISYRPISPPPTSIPENVYWPQTLWGDSTRGLLPVGFYHFFFSDNARMIAQSAVSLISWSLLGFSFYILCCVERTRNLHLICILFILLIFALSPEVTSWNKILYSESLAISTMLVGISLLILYKYRRKKLLFFLLYLFCSFLTFTARPSYLLILLAVLPILVFRYFKEVSIFVRMPSIAFLLIIIFAYQSNNNQYWSERLWSREMISISYYISQDNPHADSFIPLVNGDTEKPLCVPNVDSPLTANQQLVWSLPFNFQKLCPEASDWASTRFYPILFNWWRTEPKDALNTYRLAFISSLRSLPLFDQVTPVPQFIHGLFLPSVDSQVMYPDVYNNGPDTQPRPFYDPLFLTVAIFLSVFWKQSAVKLNNLKGLVSSFHFLLLGAIVAWLFGIIAIPGPPREVYRLAVLPELLIRMLIPICLIFYTFRNLSASKREDSSTKPQSPTL